MNDSVKGLVVFAGSSVGVVGGGGAGTVLLFVSQLLLLLSFSGLEATGKIPADLGRRHSMSGPPGLEQFHTDQLV